MRVIVRLRKAAITCDALPVRCASESGLIPICVLTDEIQ